MMCLAKEMKIKTIWQYIIFPYNKKYVEECKARAEQLGIGMFLRDTALHFRQQGIDMARAALGGIHSTNHQAPRIYSGITPTKNPYQMENPYGDKEDISWLLD